MISSEVQRTLVKSPPELWTELSDPQSLARHLGELGDIRITHVEPEQLVEWEGEGASGKVQIKASGWGTKVTLSVSRELAAVQPAEPAEPEQPELELAEAVLTEQTEQPRAEPDLTPAPATHAARSAAGWPAPAEGLQGPAIESALRAAEVAQAAPVSTPDLSGWSTQLSDPHDSWMPPVSDAPSTEPAALPVDEPEQPRRGFFARLFGGRKRASVPPQHDTQTEAEPIAQDDPLLAAEAEAEAETVALLPVAEPIATRPEITVLRPQAAAEPPAEIAAPESLLQDPVTEQPEPTPVSVEETPGLAAELQAAEETAAEEVRAILVAVLDRLGAAHHRPFSRS